MSKKHPGDPARPHKSIDDLTLKEKAFVSAIATPGTPTFGNGAKSAVLAGYASNPLDGRKRAYDLRTNPVIESAIEAVFNQHNLSIQVRSGVLGEILQKKSTEIEQYDAGGGLTARTVMSNDKMRLAVIRELNRMDGTYARAEAIGHAQAKVLEPVIDEYMRRMRAELRNGPTDAPTSDVDSVDIESGTTVQTDAVDAPTEPTTDGEVKSEGVH